MAIVVKQLSNMLKRMPGQCSIEALIPNGDGTYQTRALHRVGLHGHDGASEPHPDHPIELFSDDAASDPMTVKNAMQDLRTFGGGSLVRIAVPQDGRHHRILDIETVGFAKGDEDYPPVQLHTEPWNSLHQVIRQDDHVVGADHGDVSYARDLVRHEDGTYTETGDVKRTIAGRAPGA